jgi:Flp pilus assembly protein TadD
VARAFNVEEAKTMIRTRPQLLSLNEMFLVADTYVKGSDEFKYVFDVAARLFPQDATANLNAGAVEIEAGAYDAAIARLGRLSTPEAYNDLGVAYARQGDLTAAEANFRKAAAAGSADAAHNLEQLEKAK